MKYSYCLFLLLNLVNHNDAFTLSKPHTNSHYLRRNVDVSSYNEMDSDELDSDDITNNVINVDTYTDETAIEDVSSKEEVIDIIKTPIVPPSVLFYTGKLKNALPSDIYNSFLNKLADNRKIYIASSNLEKNLALINKITKKEKVSVISHSTSADDAIDLIKHIETEEKEEDNIENIILIDPIDHYYFKDNMSLNQYNVFKYLDEMDDVEDKISSFIEADKVNLVFKSIFKPGNNKNKKINKKALIIKSSISNRWKIFPPIPPINKYSLNLNKLKNKKIKTIENYGHFDILDPTWSNMVHNTFSRGSPSRDSSHLENYYDILIEHINDFSSSSK